MLQNKVLKEQKDLPKALGPLGLLRKIDERFSCLIGI
jgi:hypothetical protein